MRLAIPVLGLCLAAGSASAQSLYNDRDQSQSNRYDSRSSAPSPNDSQRQEIDRDDDWEDDRPERADRSSAARGAKFHLKSGDKEFHVECGAEDSTRECVDAALTLFRELQKASAPASAIANPQTGPGVTGPVR